MWETIIQVFMPIYAAVMAILVPVAVGYVVKLFRDKTGIEIEAKHRDALQSALESAARTAVLKLGSSAVSGQGRGIVVDYVRRSVPDAVREFGLDDSTIERLALPKIEKVAGDIIGGALGEAADRLSPFNDIMTRLGR